MNASTSDDVTEESVTTRGVTSDAASPPAASRRSRALSPAHLRTLGVTEQIEMYGELVILPLGMFVNIISVVIFVKIKMNKTPTGLHLLHLAVVETLYLIITAIRQAQVWSKYIDVPVVTHYHESYCIVNAVSNVMLQVWSGLLLASATVQRYVSIAFPLKTKTWNMLLITKCALVGYALFSVSVGTVSGFRKNLGIVGESTGVSGTRSMSICTCSQ